MRAAMASGALTVAGALLACAGSARAATLTLDAPDGCVDPATLEQEVADLLGRPLADVPEADFRLTIARRADGQWHSKLEQIEHRPGLPDALHVRELDANSCPELGDAAAVAMGVAIRAFESTPRAATAMDAAVATPAPPAMVRAAQPAPVHPWRPALIVSVAADNGDLPGMGLGVMAGAALRRRAVRLALTLGWLPSRDKVLDGGTGGRFQLASAAADGCFAPTWGAWTLLGCAGGELGVYWATGLGVARPESATTFWRAGRAGLGTALALSDSLALLAQATAVMPWPRPGFVLDGTNPVFRPGAVAIRIGAGLDFMF